jgi:hypothetical protein
MFGRPRITATSSLAKPTPTIAAKAALRSHRKGPWRSCGQIRPALSSSLSKPPSRVAIAAPTWRSTRRAD